MNMTCFGASPNGKDFSQNHHKSNRRNDKQLPVYPSGIFSVMCTKFPATVMALGAVGVEGDVMPAQIFQQSHRINAAGYNRVLDRVFKPWIVEVHNGRPYKF